MTLGSQLMPMADRGVKWGKNSNNNTYLVIWASLVAQLVKNLSAMQETLVKFLGQEDPLEKG